MKTTPNKPPPNNIITELHRIREGIVDSFAGDLAALTADARRRQALSGREVVSPGKEADQRMQLQKGNNT
ncbi:MAG: hypothetical protein V3T83_10780 [Acidobacteriota bacterium]